MMHSVSTRLEIQTTPPFSDAQPEPKRQVTNQGTGAADDAGLKIIFFFAAAALSLALPGSHLTVAHFHDFAPCDDFGVERAGILQAIGWLTNSKPFYSQTHDGKLLELNKGPGFLSVGETSYLQPLPPQRPAYL